MRTVINFLIVGILTVSSPAMAQMQTGVFGDQSLEKLRAENPEAYAQMQELNSRQEKIIAIADKYRAGEMTREEAEQQLTPLLEENVQFESQNLDQQIASMKDYLATLEAAKTQPELLVKKHIEMILGAPPVDAQGPASQNE